MNQTDTILALERKRLRIVNRWAREDKPYEMGVAEYLAASDRMMRLTCAAVGTTGQGGER